MAELQTLVDVARYTLAALMLAACGRSCLLILKVPVRGAVAWLLGPVVAQALYAVLLGGVIWWGLPLKHVALPLGLATVLLVVPASMDAWRAGRDSRRPMELKRSVQWLAFSAVLPIVVLLPYFVYGLSDYPGSHSPEGWAYVSLGQYLWEYPRGTHGGLAPVFQWAAHLSGARHTASASMAVLSLATHEGDAQAATGLFCALALFSYAAACAALGLARSFDRFRMALFITLAAGSGWLWNVVAVNNFDNALALGYLPAFACLASIRRTLSRSEWVLTGLLASGVIYTYPEFAAVILPCAVVLLGERSWREGDRRWASGMAIAVGVFFVLSGASWREVAQFVSAQTSHGLSSGPRAGDGLFIGLIGARTAPSAFWALGSEFTIQPFLHTRNILGVILTTLMLIGVWRLASEHEWGLVSVFAALIAGVLFFAIARRYSYGTYKFVLLAWWVVALGLVTGLETVAAWNSRRWIVVHILLVVVCLGIPAAAGIRSVRAALIDAGPSMAVVRQVQQVERLAGGRPIAIAVSDEWASQWATYYLRGAPAQLAIASGSLDAPHVRWLMDEAPRVPLNRVRLVLAGTADPGRTVGDHPDWSLIWQNDLYSLWDTGSATASSIAN